VNGLRDQVQRTLGSAYTVERELGGGGMSRVLVAQEEALGRRVVIKVLPPELAAGMSVERFRREIQVAVALQHPHIVPVLSAGEIDGLPYFIMPFVEGESLRKRLERGRLSIPEAVRILRDVARALAYAHDRGIVHRDIKPDNVLISSGSASVADFGVAKALASSRRTGNSGESTAAVPAPAYATPMALTAMGVTLGTPAYMAPEQAAADPAMDHRADLYSLGVVAYEMLTGQQPFRGGSPQQLLAAQLTEPPPPIPGLRSDVPQALVRLVMCCLEKEPAKRPHTATELVLALDDPAVMSGAFASMPTEAVHAAPVPPRPRSRTTMALGIAGIATVAALATTLLLRNNQTPAAPTGGPVAAAPALPSIAVLPLVNISRDTGDAYLADGLTEEITTGLGKIRGLRVASRTAAISAREQHGTIEEIAKRLGVTTLLEGTIQRAGNRVRLTARLINAADGFTLWSNVYENEMTDVFRVQDEISKEIVAALGQELAGDTRADSAVTAQKAADPAAYEHYLRGRYFFQKRGVDALQQAIVHYKQAIDADPSYALAHAGLAEAYGVLPNYGNMPQDSARTLALGEAEKAIALDSTLGAGYAARGNALQGLWRWADAERDLRRAIALAPDYPSAHKWLGDLLMVNGRLPEAIAELTRAAQLDVVSPIIAGSLGVALGAAGRDSEAVVRGKQAVELDPELGVARFMLGGVHLYAKRALDGIRELEIASSLGMSPATTQGMIGYAYAIAGDRAKAQAIATQLQGSTGRGQASALARVFLGLGDIPQSLTWLERAVDRHESIFTVEPLLSPMFAPLRGNPRFAALVARVGLDARVAGAR
jgi:eukaryotic-like serine/threonine-protein kinase